MNAISWTATDRRGLPIGSREIEDAIEQEQLFIRYRPRLPLNQGMQTPRLEALLRWHHPLRGVLAAEQFMPYAARYGLATTLTEWLLTTALRQTRSWRRAGDDIDVSVDLSPADLDRHLASTVAAVLEFSAAAPTAITCDIPESALAENPSRAGNVAAELNWLGVRVALDGFGGRVSSFTNLYAFHVDELKLAPALVEDLETSAERTALAITAVAIAQALGTMVIGCGVRTPADLAAVRALGCDAAEGPAVSEPLDAAGALAFVRARSHEG